MEITVGNFAKVPIFEDGGVEKLWFEVLFVDDVAGTFVGRCDNQPIAVTSVEYNENKEFKLNQIEAIIQ